MSGAGGSGGGGSQNRFLLPHSASAATAAAAAAASEGTTSSGSRPRQQLSAGTSSQLDPDELAIQLSVDTDFDSYWEEEARNPHRNRIRIGRQYQATVPPVIKRGDSYDRKPNDLETLSFCPKKSAKVSDAELDHYFIVAKSLNLFASLVETRSLLGRDVTIADLNHIRNKEGLSLASVIQPSRQAASVAHYPTISPQPSQQSVNNNNVNNNSTQVGTQSPQKSPSNHCDKTQLTSASSSSPHDQTNNAPTNAETYAFKQPFMKALSHFISLHHPCHHDRDCKKLLKDIPLEEDSSASISRPGSNLRQTVSTSKDNKPGRSRSSLKQASTSRDETDKDHQNDEASGDNSIQGPSFEDWTKEEVELFSRAIEVCGKNFGSIKKEFLPSKSVKSIVEFYYIGTRDTSDGKKKPSQIVETGDGCSSPEKPTANNNGQGGNGGTGPSSNTKSSSCVNIPESTSTPATSSSQTTTSNNETGSPTKTSADIGVDDTKQKLSTHEDATSNKFSTKTNKSETKDLSSTKSKSKNFDARMSVYNFDDEFKDDSPVRYECPIPGAEVKPLKAKPVIPTSSNDAEAANSNVGSLKFFMDGQLVLKLNACQDQQQGAEKCHWVQSGDKITNTSRQKRYTKRSDRSADSNQNGSHSNSVVSSFPDEDSKNDDMSGDEDSKESVNSFLAQKSNQGTPDHKKLKVKTDTNVHQNSQLPSPINYNRIAVNNRMKERNDNLTPSPIIGQQMPWLPANSFAMAAALLGGLHFPSPAGANVIDNNQAQSNVVPMNVASKPMDLSLEHCSPKAVQKPSSRSRSRSKNS